MSDPDPSATITVGTGPAITDPVDNATTTAATTAATTTSTTTAIPSPPPTTTATTLAPASGDEAAEPATTTSGPTVLVPVADDPELINADVDPAAFTTADPTFEGEEIKPFEVPVAEVAAPVADDTGVVQPTGWAAFDAFLDDALISNGNSAASVAVSIGGDVVHAAAFGKRSLFNNEPTTSDDRFRIASISKPITAITLLQLVEEDVVGLDEPVGQIIADHLGVAPSNSAERITLRRLLNHTSGFAKYDTQFFRKGADSCDDAARIGIARGAGGGGYRYSNMNFCVAGVLIEALTGQSYEQAAYQRVLTPLGISGMRLAPTFDPGPSEVLHATSIGRNYMETLGGAGSWIATPTDLVKIMDSLDPETPGFKPLEPEMLTLMKTPVGGQLGQRGYGLGLINYGPGRYGHTGTIESTHAMAMNRGDGVTWSITVAGPFPNNTPRLESFVNAAFEAAGFISG